MSDTTPADLGRTVARKCAFTYTGLSLALAATFFTAATLIGSYGAVARVGGAVWVFLLSMIFTMPLVTSFIKKRAGTR
jgi:hypothetical protein